MGWGTLTEITVDTIHRAIHKWKSKLWHIKKKPYNNITRVLMAKAHLKVIEVNWKALLLWDEIELEICYWKCGQRSSGQKSWGMIQLVQKLGSLLLWRCINVYGTGSLHIWKGAIKAEQWRQMLKQHVLPSFWGKALQEPTYCIYYNSIASK